MAANASSDERDIRIEKVEKLRAAGVNPYAERYEATHSLAEAKALGLGTQGIKIRGRVMLKRSFGKLIFATLQDWSGRLQISVAKENFESTNFNTFAKLVDMGDFVGVEGTLIKTQKGEITLQVLQYEFLSKTVRPLPEKFHGITDLEAKSRQRYLDILTDSSSKERFVKRIQLINSIRNFLNQDEFLEVETPILANKASGAAAKPFTTHHNALDISLYLRIAPETYLKRCIAGGFERVYEFAKCFRNEGMDASHLQEFTLLEYYAAYWNYEDNMKYTEKLIKHMLMEVNGSLEVNYQGTKIDFSGDWPRYSFQDLIKKHADIDIEEFPTKEELATVIKEKGIVLEGVEIDKIGRGNLIDQLYKKVARPKMINPQFLTSHPTDLSPLARKNDENPQIADRFQLVVNTWEIVNAYSELVDPIDQRERLILQAADRAKGDEDAMDMDEDFITCMEYGMPPISGWGMGIDRFVALITNQENLREVVLFPIMRPLAKAEGGKSESHGSLSIMDIQELGLDLAEINQKASQSNPEPLMVGSAAIAGALTTKLGLNGQGFSDLILSGESPESDFVGILQQGTKELSAFITAVAKIYPEKTLEPVKPKSINKRLKSKSFASGIDRTKIQSLELLGIPMNEIVELSLGAMKEKAKELGL